MMDLAFKTDEYEVFYDGFQGVGYVLRIEDSKDSLLITGQDMVDLRDNLDLVKANAANTSDYNRLANSILRIQI